MWIRDSVLVRSCGALVALAVCTVAMGSQSASFPAPGQPLLSTPTGPVIFQGCSSPFGPIPTIFNAAIPAGGLATIVNGAPAIFLNPNVVGSSHPLFQVWLYHHECAHHVLGHPSIQAWNPGMAFYFGHQAEFQANCAAATYLLQTQKLDMSALMNIVQMLANAPGNPARPAPAVEAMQLRQCLGIAP